MTARVSVAAEHDVAEIGEYLAGFNQALADQFVDDFRAAADSRARMPLTSRPRDDLRPGMRSFVLKKQYVVFFRPVDDTVEIVRVLHGSRNMDAVFRDEDE